MGLASWRSLHLGDYTVVHCTLAAEAFQSQTKSVAVQLFELGYFHSILSFLPMTQ